MEKMKTQRTNILMTENDVHICNRAMASGRARSMADAIRQGLRLLDAEMKTEGGER